MQYCTLEKEGFLGTFYESETPSEKAVILVGGSGEGRGMVEKRAQTLSQAGFHVLALWGTTSGNRFRRIPSVFPWIMRSAPSSFCSPTRGKSA